MINYTHLCHVEATFVFNCACQKNFPLIPFVLAPGVRSFGHRRVPAFLPPLPLLYIRQQSEFFIIFFFTPTNSPYVAIAANYSREIGRRRSITAGEELRLRAKPTASGQARPPSLRRCPRHSGRCSFMLLGLHYRSGKEQLAATPPPSNSL